MKLNFNIKKEGEMLKRNMRILAVFILFMGSLLTNAFADWRSYVWTYEYMTLPKGMKEIEYYFATEIPDSGSSNVNTMKHYFELEYGISDHWDVAAYLTYKQENNRGDSNFNYDGFKIRTRYRFGEKDKYFVDPLVYLEYKKDDNSTTPDKIEAKIILAKDIGKFNVVYNQILEQELDRSGETEHEYAFGTNYKINNKMKFGLESKGNYTEEKYYLGPTFAWAVRNFWVSMGVVWGLNDRSDDIQTRMIVGLPF